MDTQIVAVFCLSDDMLKALHHHEDAQSQMSDAEVMTTAITAACILAETLKKHAPTCKNMGTFRKCWGRAASTGVCIGSLICS